MRLTYRRCVLALLILSISISLANAQDKRGAVSDRELMALVAGNVLSNDVTHEIESRGLAFRPSEQYESLLAEAGGDTRILKALEKAKIIASADVQGGSTNQTLEHLSLGGKLLREKQYEQSAQELTAAYQGGAGPEAGFVMGELLHDRKQWQEAAAVYSEVLRQEPAFVEAHTMLSNILTLMGDAEGALREAKSALAQFPESAEAHRDAGAALDSLHKSAAAEQEFREALRIAPDYAWAHYDLGILFDGRNDWDQSIAEYKKAIALDPMDERVHYNLAIVYSKKGDTESAIREYRKAIHLNPSMLSARQNLGIALLARNLNAEAVVVFRELEATAPDFPTCHECLGTALFRIWDFKGAEEEYRKAIELDPSEAGPHVGLGGLREAQKDYAAALEEYRQAEQLDDTSVDAHKSAGRVLLATNDVPHALEELKRAEDLKPSSDSIHELYGQALESSGDHAAAIIEFKQAVALDPKQARFKLELAAAFEKSGDWVGALDQYRQAAQADRTPGVQDKYKTAQARLNQHLAAMKAAGKSAEAKALEAQVGAAKAEPGISQKVDAAMEAGFDALMKNHLDEAEAQYKEAVGLAQKLQPRDDRLATSLIRLADLYTKKNDFARTETTLQQALAANVETYGAESPMNTEPLQALGSYSLYRKDYKSALDYTTRAVDVNEKTFGEASDKVADSLRLVANVYIAQGAYDQAETYLLRAVHINEALFGKFLDPYHSLPLGELSDLYDKWNKPDKAEARYHQLIEMFEKQFGTDSPQLLSIYAKEAKALHQLGRTEEATKVELHMQSIRSAAGQADGLALAPQPGG